MIKTGDRAKHALVTVTSLDQLMSEATSKLKCTSAVRKVYFRDGTEIESLLQIPRNGEVFVSCFGERPGGSQGQKPGKLSKAQNAVSSRLADSKVQKVKVCANGSGRCVSILVKRIDDNEHFLSVLGTVVSVIRVRVVVVMFVQLKKQRNKKSKFEINSICQHPSKLFTHGPDER